MRALVWHGKGNIRCDNVAESGDVLGHEFMGEVVEAGSPSHKLKKGDRVVVRFNISPIATAPWPPSNSATSGRKPNCPSRTGGIHNNWTTNTHSTFREPHEGAGGSAVHGREPLWLV